MRLLVLATTLFVSTTALAPTVADEIVITLSSATRRDESVRDGGHQPWRSDPAMAAMAELRDFVPLPSPDVTEEAIACRVLPGRAHTVVVRKHLESPFRGLANPVASVHMARNPGDVWIATRIVIADR